jgi:16S rRNA (guanine527-N7)-methyltransferase
MDPARILELLEPYLTPKPLSFRRAAGPEESALPSASTLSPLQLQNISTYIDLLLHWNARMNLTAIRHPEEIVTRHFGESLFAARHLFPPGGDSDGLATDQRRTTNNVIDIGSGPGFPGVPIKIWAAHLHLTLIESNHKKVTFLREVIRTLALTNVEVFAGRAEDFSSPAEVVTLRAVEKFERILPIAAHLVAPAGRLTLLIGHSQVNSARTLTPNFHWDNPVPIPNTASSTLLIGTGRES